MSTEKKIAPKVTLSLSKGGGVLFCTSSTLSKRSTQHTCYQNTSEPSNPRVANQRMIVANCDGVQSVGKSWETMDHGARYMVAVLDKETNEMSLHPSSLINLKPYITSYEEEQGGPLSYGERYKNLAMTFGDSRIRKTIRGKDRIREMEVNTLDEAMVEAVIAADNTNLTSPTPLTHNDSLPPINTKAKELQDVFLITDLISQAELGELLPFTEVLKECTQEHVQTWRLQDKYPEYVLSRLPVVISDPDQAHLYLSQLLYISYLITLLKIQRKSLKNRKSNFPNTPNIVIDSIYRRFTAQGQVEGKTRTTISEKGRQKLLCHLLALTLVADNYCVPIEPLCKDTGVKLETLYQGYKAMGCTISKIKGSGTGNLVAVLKLPVKLPAIVLKRGSKKRD